VTGDVCLVGAEIFVFTILTGSGAHPAYWPVDTGRGWGECVWYEAEYSLSSDIQVQNAWSCTCTSPYISMIKHRNNLSLHFMIRKRNVAFNKVEVECSNLVEALCYKPEGCRFES
jgi:hypothetical protein